MGDSLLLRPVMPSLWQNSCTQRLVAGLLGVTVLFLTVMVFRRPFGIGRLLSVFVGLTLLEVSIFGGSVREAVATSLGAYLGLIIVYLYVFTPRTISPLSRKLLLTLQ